MMRAFLLAVLMMSSILTFAQGGLGNKFFPYNPHQSTGSDEDKDAVNLNVLPSTLFVRELVPSIAVQGSFTNGIGENPFDESKKKNDHNSPLVSLWGARAMIFSGPLAPRATSGLPQLSNFLIPEYSEYGMSLEAFRAIKFMYTPAESNDYLHYRFGFIKFRTAYLSKSMNTSADSLRTGVVHSNLTVGYAGFSERLVGYCGINHVAILGPNLSTFDRLVGNKDNNFYWMDFGVKANFIITNNSEFAVDLNLAAVSGSTQYLLKNGKGEVDFQLMPTIRAQYIGRIKLSN